MTKRTKHTGLLVLTGALVSLILLATSLSNLQLQSGTPFPGSGNSDNAIQSDTVVPAVQTYTTPIQRGIIALIFIILTVYVLVRLIALVKIKINLRLMLAMVILITIGYLMPRISPDQPAYFPDDSSEITTPPSFDYPVTPLGQPPEVLIWLVIIGIVFGLSIPVIKIVNQRLHPSQIETELLQDAEDAVNALNAGVNLRNVILRCYIQMSRSLQEERGIQRKTSMTVREFEDWLISMGLPTVPVHQLTTLFEKVRYGEGHIGENDEKIAVESLNKIIEFCRSERV